METQKKRSDCRRRKNQGRKNTGVTLNVTATANSNPESTGLSFDRTRARKMKGTAKD